MSTVTRLIAVLLISIGLTAPAAADAVIVTLDASVADTPQTGRLLLFFATATLPEWERVSPINGPFFTKAQPIASMPVTQWKPGTSIRIEHPEIIWPGPIEQLDGATRIQVLLDVDRTERSHEEGPGNIVSAFKTVTLAPDVDDVITLTLDKKIEPALLPADSENIKWVELRSDTLSTFCGVDVYHRAGVVLPAGWNDDPTKSWPAVYIIPGYGGRHTMAAMYERRIDSLPPAVHIVLDCESSLGHHGFVDSPNHGPRGTAFINEFIPHLERTFRLKPERDARIVTGHSSGGWSCLWLQLKHPDVFGACFSSAPDPVDFRSFGVVNIYDDTNMFSNAEGGDNPSYRHTYRDGRVFVRMLIREEAGMEWAIEPNGGSGQQWDAWEAMFSPVDSTTKLPRALFDPRTGVIDKDVAKAWKAYDIAQLVRDDWETFGPIMTDRVRLTVGSVDSFYLERAVGRLKGIVDAKRAEAGDAPTGRGYIEIVEGADHGTISFRTRARWNEEITALLTEHAEPVDQSEGK
jgi:pimeloyl-ACP methyl ester carboxylesterase